MKSFLKWVACLILALFAVTLVVFLYVVDRAFPDKQAGDYEQLPLPPRLEIADTEAFVYVRAGELSLGAPDDADARFSENFSPWIAIAKPRLNVRVPHFEIGKYEITSKDFCQFLNSMKSTAKSRTPYIVIDEASTIELTAKGYVPKLSYENAPAIHVTYLGARRYCEWLTERLGVKYRLPTEIEWEYVARGRAGSTYPWGEEDPKGRAFLFPHYSDTLTRSDPHIVSVGSFPTGANPDGVNDLIGNAREWCGNYWFDYQQVADLSIFYERSFAEPPLSMATNHTVIRGGQYVTPLDVYTGWTRVPGGFPLESANRGVSFRVVREL